MASGKRQPVGPQDPNNRCPNILAFLLVQPLLLVTMSRNTATIENDIAPQSTDTDIKHSSDVSEKKTELDSTDAANKTEEHVKEDAEPEIDTPSPSGGPKACPRHILHVHQCMVT